ncbi:hypothetical protein PF005_g27266 [Phytophthora fragariae]|uniref:Uncharacterized protein n=1 Tax=Phytophthora fragariae TaxID=53985 RepID=A0A6A3W2V8_9STRA|nr:hypothetical protein PF003_g32749 [Phytophthora fragariae]KAE8925461.1 hypothetical protein PF009_g24334 [Phytophthora fragariae]KAE8970070.1 hypothetical protein PF011_g26560 [Phytophthora fragariae]KAE9068195.1 hypothetical protein PF010_g27156 [Phytophthora fragariae]KAE9080829.1 hypothetical protein PF007_g22887 [Phytophthora fragariae]
MAAVRYRHERHVEYEACGSDERELDVEEREDVQLAEEGAGIRLEGSIATAVCDETTIIADKLPEKAGSGGERNDTTEEAPSPLETDMISDDALAISSEGSSVASIRLSRRLARKQEKRRRVKAAHSRRRELEKEVEAEV